MAGPESQRIVEEAYPGARCVWHEDCQVFKVYYLVGECRVSLSGGFPSMSEVWSDAARRLSVRATSQ